MVPEARVLLTAAAVAALTPLPWRGVEAAERVVPVVDLHVDLAYQHRYKARPFETGKGRYLARALRGSGVHGVVLPLYIPKDVSKRGPRYRDLEGSYWAVRRALARTRPYSRPGCEAATSGDVLTFPSFEGAAPLARWPDSVERWRRRGVRLFGLVHSYDNELATSATGVDARAGRHHGLSQAGVDLSQRILDSGGVLDLSHASDAAVDAMIRLSKAAGRPIVATHSNARRLHGHPRNLTDGQLRAIGASGGVVGINFHSPFLGRRRTAHVSDVVAHVRHAVRVAGIDHVAIGSDFEGGIRPPGPLSDVRGFPRLARALRAGGFSRDDVEKIFARNALRVLCPDPIVGSRAPVRDGLAP